MRNDGTFAVIGELSTVASRLVAGRDSGPGAAIIDSQSARTTESRGISGYDAGKKVKGRKRHITVDDDPLQDLSILSADGGQGERFPVIVQEGSVVKHQL